VLGVGSVYLKVAGGVTQLEDRRTNPTIAKCKQNTPGLHTVIKTSRVGKDIRQDRCQLIMPKAFDIHRNISFGGLLCHCNLWAAVMMTKETLIGTHFSALDLEAEERCQ
jgi:hypothetical protein